MKSLALLLVLAAILPSAATAGGSAVDRAADELRSDPVYVHPDAERSLDADQEQALEDRIADGDAGPVYVAVLPADASAETGGSAGGLVQALYEALDRPGTYAVVAGDSFRAGSTVLDDGRAGELASQALDDKGDDTAAVLGDFVGLVAAERNGEAPGSDGSADDGGGFPWLFALLAGGAAVFFLLRRRRRREEQAEQVQAVRAEANADLLALGDDIRALDLAVELPEADAEGRAAYGRALDHYERAGRALDRARRADELEPVAAELDRGRYEMEVAKALLAGRTPPERRVPCFFDPRHGPSVDDVEWSPPGGGPRPVPVCAADRERLARGEEPAHREVSLGGRRMPYWQASPAFGPYMGGFFGGGLLPGLLVGTMLGTGWGPFGEGGPGGDIDSGGGDFGGDFGDFGGGDFGGGDFGGGGGE